MEPVCQSLANQSNLHIYKHKMSGNDSFLDELLNDLVIKTENNLVSMTERFPSPTSSSSPDDVQEEHISKKKLQNRRAQRDFRRRKEARMKSLESQLNEAQQITDKLHEEVNSLRRDNIEMSKINRHLIKQHRPHHHHHQITDTPTFAVEFPSQQAFIDHLIPSDSIHRQTPPKTITYNDPNGDMLLTIPATWHYLLKVSQEEDDIDINRIMAQLRGNERCHGHGAAYSKKLIDSLIQSNEINNF